MLGFPICIVGHLLCLTVITFVDGDTSAMYRLSRGYGILILQILTHITGTLKVGNVQKNRTSTRHRLSLAGQRLII